MLKRGQIWPLLVGAALLFTVGVNVVMLFAASSDRNGSVVEPDYYRKGVEWDRTMAEREASARLGWRATASLSPRDRGRELIVVLTDAAGIPIQGALVEVTLIHNTDAAHPEVVTLAEGDEPGRYSARVAAAPRGRWELRVEARRAEDRFGVTLHQEAP